MHNDEIQQYKALRLAELIKSESWKLFEEFIDTYICNYIDSSLPRDQLIGMRKSVHLVKKFVDETVKSFEK